MLTWHLTTEMGCGRRPLLLTALRNSCPLGQQTRAGDGAVGGLLTGPQDAGGPSLSPKHGIYCLKRLSRLPLFSPTFLTYLVIISE